MTRVLLFPTPQGPAARGERPSPRRFDQCPSGRPRPGLTQEPATARGMSRALRSASALLMIAAGPIGWWVLLREGWCGCPVRRRDISRHYAEMLPPKELKAWPFEVQVK
ncbi:hypothetical protein, partial [Nocardia sp. NPDC004260]